jgi:predicted nuclease of predicted toxin-antitoxin system
MDEHVPHAITEGLSRRGVDVLTAQEDGRAGTADPDLLDRAGTLGRAMVTSDHDFEVEAARRQQGNIPFSGVIFVRAGKITIAKCIEELELISLAGERHELVNLLLYLPL